MARELGAAVNARGERKLSLREIAAKLADAGKARASIGAFEFGKDPHHLEQRLPPGVVVSIPC
jgi:hypothetical protein